MNRFTKVMLIASLIICFVFTIFDIIPLKKVVNDNTWVKDYVQISAHRGGASLNPENTKKAFDYVIKETNYTDIVEMDLRLTKDNVIVLSHDGDINRMALDDGDASIDIDKHNYSELINYNLGRNFVDLNGNKPYFNYSIEQAKEEGLTLMSLEDFFVSYNEFRDFKVFLEVKEDEEKGKYMVDKIMEMLNTYTWWKDRSMIISFDDDLIDYMAKKYSEQYIGAVGRKAGFQIGFSKAGLDIFYNVNYQCVHVPYNEKAKDIIVPLDDKRLVNSFKERNQLTVYWGVEGKKDMKRLIDIGVDVITTDRPDLLYELIKKGSN